MISLICTSCRAVLQIDDAFVGGVCRCQHCGAIQTVPSHLKKGATEKKVKSQKTLYRKSVRDEGVPSSGLDQLAQVVSSSGLSPGRLQELEREPRPKPRRGGLMIGGAVAAGLILVLAGVWFLMPARQDPVASGPVSVAHAAPQGGVAAPTTIPSFLGVPVDAQVVIYVLDCGSGTSAPFSHLKAATLKSVATLGSGRKFQIIFWGRESGGEIEAYPLGGPTTAVEANVTSAGAAMERVQAFGQTNVGPALAKAVAAAPQVIMLATGKGAQLDDVFVEQVLEIVKKLPVKVHTFDIGGSEISPALKTIADRTGGKSMAVSEGDLTRLVRD